MPEQLSYGVLRQETAPEQSLSIRCLSDGLAFSVRSVVTPAETIERGFLPFTPEVGLDTHDRLLALFYSQEFLTYPYQQITCYLTPEAGVLVPAGLVQEGQEGLWLFADVDEEKAQGDTKHKHYQSIPLPDGSKSFVMRSSRELYQFLRRSWLVFDLQPSFLPALEACRQANLSGATLSILLEEGTLTGLLLQRGEVQSYHQHSLKQKQDIQLQAEEVLFYIFSLWRHLGLDPQADRLALCLRESAGDSDMPSEEAVFEALTTLLTPHLTTIDRVSYTAC